MLIAQELCENNWIGTLPNSSKYVKYLFSQIKQSFILFCKWTLNWNNVSGTINIVIK